MKMEKEESNAMQSKKKKKKREQNENGRKINDDFVINLKFFE